MPDFDCCASDSLDERYRPSTVPARRLPGSWPNKGAIVAESLVVRYRPELDPVLDGLSFSIAGGRMGARGQNFQAGALGRV